MLDGIYRNPTTIFFGRSSAPLLGSETRKQADHALLLYGGGSIKKNGVYQNVTDALQTVGVAYTELFGVVPNPRAELVRHGIQICRENRIGLILAVGGGSVIDSAKAIAIGTTYRGDVRELFLGATPPATALKLGVVLTLPGAGSESSPDTVINFNESEQKLPLSSPLLYPTFAFLNPEFTFSLNQKQTMAGIIDAICHALERYFTNTTFVDCSDRLAEGLIRTLMKYAPLLLKDPQNYDYRAEVMWACKLAHDNTVGFGRKQDWATHRIAHEVAAIYDTAHGATLGVLFPAWMEHCHSLNHRRFIQLARQVFDIPAQGDGSESPEGEVAARFRAFFHSMGMPTTLRELGIQDKTRFSRIAANSVMRQQSGTIGNFVRLAPHDILRILESAY